MKSNRVQIEAVKLAMSNWNTDGATRQQILEESIRVLLELYEIQRELYLLEKAISYIAAFLELGFVLNDEEKCLFEKILKSGRIEAEKFYQEHRKVEHVVLNKSQVRSMLGRWNPTYHSHKIDDVVNDIIEKVKKNQVGTYLYHCGKSICAEGQETLWVHTYRLYVSKEESIFYSVNKNKYYMLEE